MKSETAESLAPDLNVSFVRCADLLPFAGNARLHAVGQVAEIQASMLAYGYTNPVLADGLQLVAGHGRLQALQGLWARGEVVKLPNGQPLPVGTIPRIDCSGWTEQQRRAYILADNRLAENASWDADLLKAELQWLGDSAFDLDLTGFDGEAITLLFDDGGPWGSQLSGSIYTQKVNSPEYIPKGDRPAIEDLTDHQKAQELLSALDADDTLTGNERAFLMAAAARHVVFDYHRIAEFYCHASPQVQAHMEASALVIIDFDKAIAGGFVRMSDRLDSVYTSTFGTDEEGAAEAAEAAGEAYDAAP